MTILLDIIGYCCAFFLCQDVLSIPFSCIIPLGCSSPMEVQLIVQRRHGKSEVPVSRKELIDMLHDRPLVTRQVWSFPGESHGT